MSRPNKGEWEGNGGRKRERAMEGGRESGAKQCVKEREGECEWAGSRCRCAESCSFFPLSLTENSKSRASCWNTAAVSSPRSRFTSGQDVRASPAKV